MTKEMVVRNSISISAPIAKVWESLTSPEWTKKYMYSCEVLSDWKPGSPVVWKMMHEGKEFIPVTGSVLQVRPGRFLEYTVFDPNVGMEDIPANHLKVTYDLSEEGGATLLNVTQGGYEHAANGEKRYEDAVNGGGWSSILEKIKELLEQ